MPGTKWYTSETRHHFLAQQPITKVVFGANLCNKMHERDTKPENGVFFVHHFDSGQLCFWKDMINLS